MLNWSGSSTQLHASMAAQVSRPLQAQVVRQPNPQVGLSPQEQEVHLQKLGPTVFRA